MGCNQSKPPISVIEPSYGAPPTCGIKKENLVDETIADKFLPQSNECLGRDNAILHNAEQGDKVNCKFTQELENLSNDGDIYVDGINEDIKLHLEISCINDNILKNMAQHSNNNTEEKDKRMIEYHENDNCNDVDIDNSELEEISSPALENTYSQVDIIDNLNLSEIKKVNKQLSFSMPPNDSQISVVEVEDIEEEPTIMDQDIIFVKEGTEKTEA